VAVGNLVINPSFESGKVKQIDSLTQSIQIEGWNFIGNGVRWLRSTVDQNRGESEFIHSGSRAVRIIRTDADETDDFGIGAITDYIRVIPGNYNLSLFISLQDVTNPKSRLGTSIYDAIDIRLIYYDRNRLEINPSKFSPYHNNYYDNSFKALSLSNYTSIDSTGWIHIQGKSHCFPVPDGDLQDETRFVRIFVGLKGNGQMCVDDVSFTYSPLNLTSLERMEPYFDSTFDITQVIIPKPRSVKVMESIIYYRPYYKDVFPSILIPANANEQIVRGARMLEKEITSHIARFTALRSEEIPGLIVNNITRTEQESKVVFSIGTTSLFNSVRDKLPLDSIAVSPQGFLLYSNDDRPSTVYMYGNSPDANLYAVEAAIQLFDNNRLLFHNARVIDYPASAVRPMLLNRCSDYSIDFLETGNLTRFTAVYLPGSLNNLQQVLHRLARNTSMNLNLFTQPDDGVYTDVNWPENIISDTLLFKRIGTIAVLEETLTSEQRSASGWPEDLCSESPVQRLVDKGIQVERIPFLSMSGGYGYKTNFKDISTTSEAEVIYAGDGLSTWKIDEADLNLFRTQFPDSKLFLDLSLYARSESLGYFQFDSLWPNKLPTACLFESFRNEILPEVYNGIEVTIAGYEIKNIFDRIRMQTASDFFWNPENYNPDMSLYRALVNEFGPDLARDLLHYNNLYFLAKSELIHARNPANMQRHIRRSLTFMEELRNLKIKINAENADNGEILVLINKLFIGLEDELKSIQKKGVEN
jgi:hypothetical protein